MTESKCTHCPYYTDNVVIDDSEEDLRSKKITDEELAEKYVRNATNYSDAFVEKQFDRMKNPDNKLWIDSEIIDLYEAFLAGLKAGKSQWHYPSKGELPEDDRLVVIYYKGGVADFGSYTKGLNGWHNKFGDSISEPYMWISLKPPKEM